jgi:transposase InsO family protein
VFGQQEWAGSVPPNPSSKWRLIKPRHPWQNGKAERFNRTLQEGWAYRRPFASNRERADALQPWLDFHNHHRPHGSLGGKPPVSRCRQPAA